MWALFELAALLCVLRCAVTWLLPAFPGFGLRLLTSVLCSR